MNSILLLSLLVRIGALGWSLVIWHRLRDWRVGIIAFVIVLMTLRQGLTTFGVPDVWPLSHIPNARDIPSLIVSACILALTIIAGRMIETARYQTRDFAAANKELRHAMALCERAQSRLAVNERMLSTLMSNLPGMVYRCRCEPGCTMEFCSDGCRGLTGFDAADLVGNKKTSYAELIHPNDRDMVWRGVHAALAESQPFEMKYRINTATGDEKWVWDQGCAVPDGNGGTTLEGFIIDVTETKLVEDQLRQAQKMEIVGQLTGGVAHDFNNLLAIMIGNLELASESAEQGSEHQNHILRALDAAERGATLTRQLLAFSRKQVLQPQSVDLNKLVPRAIELFHRALGETIEIETVLAGGLWKTMVDPGQLEHALLNLAVNARDAMPNGGRLTIETANARLDEEYRQLNRFARPGAYVMLAVSDNGTGMAPDVAARAFEPFFTTKDVGKGSGLGLSMVYGFVKQSGGHVNIYSEVGRGTTIKLYFPRAREHATPIFERPLGTVPPGQRSILLVEDDPDVRRLSVDTLTDNGYRVIEAQNGRAALEILKDGAEIDLLFTDLVLPGGVDGVDLAKQARSMRPKIKVLYTTGYGYNAAKRNNGFEDGTEVLAKPYRKAELIRKIREVLGCGVDPDN